MSKFNEICDAWETLSRQYGRYEEDCRNFAKNLMGGLEDYLAIPKGRLHYFPVDEEITSQPRYSLYGAMKQAKPRDPFWNFRVVLTMSKEPADPLRGEIYPFVGLVIWLKKGVDHYVVKFGADAPEQTIHEDHPEEFTMFYTNFFETLSDLLENDFDRFVQEQPSNLGQIGFRVPN